MWSRKKKLNYCGKITAIVILMSFLMMSPVYGEPQIKLPGNSTAGGTRLYSDLEIGRLIEELTAAAEEAVEQAAAEAAKAAALAALDREAEAIREAAKQQAEARRWRMEAETLKKGNIRNAVFAGLICFVGGVAAGSITVGIIRR